MFIPKIVCVTPGSGGVAFQSCYPCSPCSPDEVREGSQCNPCSPCRPDQLSGGSQCNPCSPCRPDQMSGGSQCNPCHPCSPDQMNDGESGKSGCFLTSACTASLHLPDDCEELTLLRRLRDTRKAWDHSFAAAVREYYEVAPGIVAAIDALPGAKAIYAGLYQRLILPCVDFIRNGEEDSALELYSTSVLALKQQYLP